MVSFQRLHSHLKLLSSNHLKGNQTECGFKRAFVTLFGQDVDTFTGTMFLNMDQLEKQLDKEEFQEIGSMAAFKVLETQFRTFIKSRIYLDDEYVIMTRKYFLEYTQLEIPEFYDTLIQHMESMQTTEEKVDTSNALDASLVDIKSSGTESGEQDTSSRSGNDAHADDADIRPIYDEEPMAEERDSAVIKPHHVSASSESRNSTKNMPIFSSNDMVHNQYLDETRKKKQEKGRNSEPSIIPSTRLQSTANGRKPKPRIDNQKSRNWPASKTSYVTIKTVLIAKHSRNS
ncbi:hypothetical protein Tco_1323225 [Tanacetum coccineum]